jgi:hypothetical protein
MRQFFSFWWQCAKVASKGNAAFANDWQWLVGYPATAILLWILGYFYAELSGRIEVTLASGAWGAFGAAFVAYLFTWIASFIGRFLNAPVLLYHGEKEILPTNNSNALCIVTGNGEPFDHVEVNQHGVHHTIAVGIRNVGSRKITNCKFYRTYVGFTGDSQKTFLEGPFSLDPNETRYLSIAMFNETKDLPHANHLIGLSLPPGAFGAGIMVPRLPPDRRHVLSFVAESVDAGNAVLHCEVLVSDAGKLRLETL